MVGFADWEKVTLISLTNEFPYLSFFRKTIEALQRTKVRIEFHHIGQQIKINIVTEFIKRFPTYNSKQSLVILFGNSRHQARFLDKILRKLHKLPFFPLLTSALWPGSITVKGKWLPLADHIKILNHALMDYSWHWLQISYLQLEGYFPTIKYNALAEYLRVEAAKNTDLFYTQLQAMSDRDVYKWLKTSLIYYRQKKDKAKNSKDYHLIRKGKVLYLNAFHVNAVIASSMIIQLMCSIQTFRGRNLPSVMNDGLVLMYTTFTLAVIAERAFERAKRAKASGASFAKIRPGGGRKNLVYVGEFDRFEARSEAFAMFIQTLLRQISQLLPFGNISNFL